MHRLLIKEKQLDGIESVNEHTYSHEALPITLDNNPTLMGTSDIHGLIDWKFEVAQGGHRPITLMFTKERNEASVKEAKYIGRFDILNVEIENNTSCAFILKNNSSFTLHNSSNIITLKTGETTIMEVKKI